VVLGADTGSGNINSELLKAARCAAYEPISPPLEGAIGGGVPQCRSKNKLSSEVLVR
jgi:hypothetical protein